MIRTVLGVYRESARGERRVALTPPVVRRVRDFGLDVAVEASAGNGAGFPDDAYRDAGADVVDHERLHDIADLLVGVNLPGVDASRRFRPGQIMLGLLRPTRHAVLMRRWAEAGLTAFSLDLVPQEPNGTLRLDAAASQEAVAGCRAALLALHHLDRLTPADSPAPVDAPVRALVVGDRADARQAARTLARLGATVSLWSPPRHPDEAPGSLPAGVRPLSLPSGDAVEALAGKAAAFDVLITALRAGDSAPRLLRRATLRTLLPGAVVVDLTAGPLGGNVEGADPCGGIRVCGGVTLVGAPELAAGVPAAASTAYAGAVEAVLAHLLVAGRPRIDPADPFQAATLVTHAGQVVHEPTWQRLLVDIRSAGLP